MELESLSMNQHEKGNLKIQLVKESKKANLPPTMSHLTAGIDEVGVSSIAGSMVCAVVILPKRHGIKRLPVDSKVLEDRSIQEVSLQIEEKALYYAIFAISPEEVDSQVQKIGMLALQKNMWKYVMNYVRESFPDISIILDGKHSVKGIPNVKAIVGADNKYPAVSASAIISKHWCDENIREESKKYPEYLLAKHKGYPTRQHVEAIRQYGCTPFHRIQMTQKALSKPEDTRSYSLEEMEKALRTAGDYLKEDMTLANEGTIPFLREMWREVIQKKTLPSEKQQRFAMNVCRQVLKNYKRAKKRISL